MAREPFGKMSPEGQRGCIETASIAPIVHQASIRLTHMHTDMHGNSHSLFSLILPVTLRHTHNCNHTPTHKHRDDMTVSGSCVSLSVCLQCFSSPWWLMVAAGREI